MSADADIIMIWGTWSLIIQSGDCNYSFQSLGPIDASRQDLLCSCFLHLYYSKHIFTMWADTSANPLVTSSLLPSLTGEIRSVEPQQIQVHQHGGAVEEMTPSILPVADRQMSLTSVTSLSTEELLCNMRQGNWKMCTCCWVHSFLFFFSGYTFFHFQVNCKS